jgi:hypothetical protein
MTADHRHQPTCIVCRKIMAVGDSYLVRVRAGEPTAVHQHLCFPPSVRQLDTRVHATA